LPQSRWFQRPYDEMQEVEVCTLSGYRANPNCKETQAQYVQTSGLKTKPCPYHILTHLDKSGLFQVNTSCESPDQIQHQSWFVLPPLMAYYYKQKNPFYKPLPSYRSDCMGNEPIAMEFIYPKENNSVFLPKDFDGKTNELILKIAHSKPELTVFWYLDDTYLGSTKDIHEMALIPSFGKHVLTVVDELGNEAKRQLEISR
ncbi:MAG: penicillin-binding protein 1C, partial [Mangrovimonas sp.]|nr:penicillin-binding protein 1C [Mangrovimonas sp.]